MGDFRIVKKLNKQPNKYPNIKQFPQVKVALDMIKADKAKTQQSLVGHFIPYFIIKGKGALGEKAIHPSTFVK